MPCTARQLRQPRRYFDWRLLWVTLLAACLGGCMALPDVSARPWQQALPVADSGPLAQLAAASTTDGLSGFRLIGSGIEALQARLVLIEGATRSLDLQVYQFKGDASGRALMRALRDAAARGVRVRLLVDDLYTAGDDGLWLALSAQPGLELRLFNAFLAGRESHLSRLVETAVGHERMHRRMHNKLLVADGVLALAGGRNIADAYFLPTPQGSYVDIDVLVAGALVPQMAQAFDQYWNSDYSHTLHSILEAGLPGPPPREAWADALDRPCDTAACAAVAKLWREPGGLALEMAQGRVSMQLAQATVLSDSPAKIDNAEASLDIGMLATSGAQVRLVVAQAIRQAKQELVIVSPYLIPSPLAIGWLAELSERGAQVTILTNSLAATDEPMVHVGYRKYRAALLRAGVALYEWSPARGDRVWRELLVGGAVLRLHAKAALVDRERVFLGSMNFDPRSRDLNTEFGLMIRSPELAEELHALLTRLMREGAYRLQLDDDGRTLRWSTADSGVQLDGFEPGSDFGSRLLLDLLEPLVPEELL